MAGSSGGIGSWGGASFPRVLAAGSHCRSPAPTPVLGSPRSVGTSVALGLVLPHAARRGSELRQPKLPREQVVELHPTLW